MVLGIWKSQNLQQYGPKFQFAQAAFHIPLWKHFSVTATTDLLLSPRKSFLLSDRFDCYALSLVAGTIVLDSRVSWNQGSSRSRMGSTDWYPERSAWMQRGPELRVAEADWAPVARWSQSRDLAVGGKAGITDLGGVHVLIWGSS